MKYLIAGLGNMGEKYINTRHNVGFLVVNAMAKDADAIFDTQRYADIAKIKYRGRTLVLLKPNTYMNLSGNAIAYWMEKEKINLSRLLVIVDDIALPLGSIRLKAKGGDGGHNGLIHIIEKLQTQNFPRLRIGIGNDFAQGYQTDYVLGEWSGSEEKLIPERIKMATSVVKSFVTIGINLTMTQFNNR